MGIAFQSLKHEDAENIGFIIPTPVVWHFIQDYERNQRYTGFPCLGVEWQKLENPDLRAVLGMAVSRGRRGGEEGAKSRCIRRGEGSKPSR